MSYCFNFSAYKRFFVKILIETNVNISNELNFSDVYLCIRPNVVYTSINIRKMKYIPEVIPLSRAKSYDFKVRWE